jgi:hypothetical protein
MATKAELVEEARRLGVDRADELKMDELKEAISKAESVPAVVLGDEGRGSRNSREPQSFPGVPGVYGSGRAVDLAVAAEAMNVSPDELVEQIADTPLEVASVAPSRIRRRTLGHLAARRERGVLPGAVIPLPESGSHLPSSLEGTVIPDASSPPVSEAADDAAREVVAAELAERAEAEQEAAEAALAKAEAEKEAKD